MNVIELLARLNGEVLSNKARANVGGKIVILARLTGTEWEYTPEGQVLADAHSNQVVAEAEAKTVRTRKVKDTAADTVAVQSTYKQPEL